MTPPLSFIPPEMKGQEALIGTAWASFPRPSPFKSARNTKHFSVVLTSCVPFSYA